MSPILKTEGFFTLISCPLDLPGFFDWEWNRNGAIWLVHRIAGRGHSLECRRLSTCRSTPSTELGRAEANSWSAPDQAILRAADIFK